LEPAVGPNTIFKNPTKPATSSVKILGVTVGQPSGLNVFMSASRGYLLDAREIGTSLRSDRCVRASL
jgi:hypothetical protein